MRMAWAWLAGAAGALALVMGALVLLPRPEAPEPVMPEPVASVEPAEPAATPEPVASDPSPTEPAEHPTLPEVVSLRVEGDGLSVIAGRALPDEEVVILLDGAEVVRAHAGADGQFSAIVTLPATDMPQVLALLADPGGRALPSQQEILLAPRPEMVPQTDAPPPAGDAQAGTGDSPPQLPEGEADPIPEPIEPPATPDAVPAAAPASLPEGGASTEAPPEAGSPDDADPRSDEPAATPQPAPETGIAALATTDGDRQPQAPAEISAPDAGAVSTPAAPAPTAPAAADTAPRPLDGQLAPAEAPQTAAPDLATPEGTGTPPALVLDAEGVRVLGTPPAVPGVPLDSVALDIISYDPAGEVSLAGRAGQNGFVRVYLDNASVAATTVMDGRWDVALPEVVPGTYTLRVDQVDEGGAVVSRIESPFLRESPDALAATLAEGARESAGLTVETVQPGSSLWRIARERYGRGILYVQVFEANRDRIRNPDLIYPGQVFLLPEIETEVIEAGELP